MSGFAAVNTAIKLVRETTPSDAARVKLSGGVAKDAAKLQSTEESALMRNQWLQEFSSLRVARMMNNRSQPSDAM